jgi:tetratricopeptide (TPR) repeat protein
MSVKPIVDEMIVVDTGSTDKSKDIAAAFGAKVFDFVWTHDFSEARNYSLSHANGDWILVLDADEVLSPLDHDKFRKISTRKPRKRIAYTLVTRNYTNQAGSKGWTANEGQYVREEIGRGWVPSPKVRLFANKARIRFENPVHELVEPSLKKLGIKIKTCDIPVHHYGRLNQDRLIAKGKEYYRLGMCKIGQTQGDYNALKELAIQASEIGEYGEAVNVWQKVIELNSNDAVAYMNMGFAFLMMRQYEQALKFSKAAMEIDPDLREAALNYSAAEMIAGDISKAISVLECILKKHVDYPPAMGRLAAACIVSGQKEEGGRYLDKLKTKGFDFVGMLEEQSRAFISENKIEPAIALLKTAMEKGVSNGSIHALLAECLQKIRYSTPALEPNASSCILPVQEAGLVWKNATV